MSNVYVIKFGPNEKIKNATAAAKFFRKFFDITNRLCPGDSTYAPNGGYAYLTESGALQSCSWEHINVIRELSNHWITRDRTLVFIADSIDYVGSL